jgi:hypothetical protein
MGAFANQLAANKGCAQGSLKGFNQGVRFVNRILMPKPTRTCFSHRGGVSIALFRAVVQRGSVPRIVRGTFDFKEIQTKMNMSEYLSKARNHLVGVAEAEAVTTYPTLSNAVGVRFLRNWGTILRRIDEEEIMKGRPPLSPLVVSTVNKRPKDGCRHSAVKRRDPLARDPEFEIAARDRAWRYWRKPKKS